MDYEDNTYDGRDAFDNITAQLTRPASPYEAQPVQQGSAKKTLTSKGKVGLAAAGVLAVGAGVVGWQFYAADSSSSALATEQVALQRQQTQIELAKVRTEADVARTKNFTACVEQGKDKVGEFGQSRMDDLIEKCNAAFPASAEMNAAPVGSDEDGGFGGWWILALGAGVGLWLGGKKVAKSVGDNA